MLTRYAAEELPVAAIFPAPICRDHRRRHAGHPHDGARPPVDAPELHIDRVEGERDSDQAEQRPQHDLAEHACPFAERVAASAALGGFVTRDELLDVLLG